MPNYTPASRYLLAGMAILMLFAALPTAGDVFQAYVRSRALRNFEHRVVERIRFVNQVPPMPAMPPMPGMPRLAPMPPMPPMPAAPPMPKYW